MNIVACVKQVPDTEAQIKVKPDGSGIEEGGIKWVMNPYDEFGVEEALRLKEKNGGEVTIVCLGPARAMETIRTALAMGADKGIHISDPAFDGADAYTTASALAAAIKGIPHDIIFCGQRAIDDDSAQVGAVLAELLGIPQVTVVTKFEFAGQLRQGHPAHRRGPASDRVSASLPGDGAEGAQRTALRVSPGDHESEKETRRCEKCRRTGRFPGQQGQGGQVCPASGEGRREDHLRRRHTRREGRGTGEAAQGRGEGDLIGAKPPTALDAFSRVFDE